MPTQIRTIGKAIKLLDSLILLNASGLLLELVLIDHYENTKQIIPIISLLGVLILTLLPLIKVARSLSQIFQLWMIITVIVGIAGLIFHAYGNYEFAMEIYPNSSTAQLFVKTLKGATPLFAPGAMIGLGLLGIIRQYINKLHELS